MSLPLELSFQNLERSDFIEENVKQRYKKLQSISSEISRCHVVIKAPHKHHHQGNHYEVTIDLKVPGAELAVAKNTGVSEAHEDLYVALRDAFDAMVRQLSRWKDKRRLDVKQHSRPAKPDPSNEQ